MARLPLIMVGCTLVVAFTVLVVLGRRVLERDRDALFDRYGQQREQAIAEAARGVASEISDIGDDLELAATLLESANEPELAGRELRAIATIKREYIAMHARGGAGATTKVIAFDAPPGAAARSEDTLEQMLAYAADHPRKLHVSGAYAAPGGPAGWYRVFARRPVAQGPTVAVVVDLAILLARMKLPRDPMTRALVLDGTGAPAAISDRPLAALVHDAPAAFAPLRASVLGGATARAIVDGEQAHLIGLPDATALALGVPLRVEGGPPWTLMAVTSTQVLETQERTIVRRVLLGGALVLVLLLSAAAYVLHNTFRARTLRERIHHAEHLRRIEQRLVHTEKLATAGQVAAGIAHEIGTPLNVARGRVELTLSHLGKDHKEADNQRLVIDQIDRVTRLIQQLLDYVRPAPAIVRQVDLAHELRVVSDLLAPQAANRHVSVHVDEATAAARLHADPDQVQQIVVNLTLNAIAACERGGTVSLRASSRADATVLEVSDNGHGIPTELQKQVFDPFFTTRKRGQGTGLGLWVVAELVRAQSAEIELDSTPGHGTTVRVAWPVRA